MTRRTGTSRTVETEVTRFDRRKAVAAVEAGQPTAIETVVPRPVGFMAKNALPIANLQRQIDRFFDAILNPLLDDQSINNDFDMMRFGADEFGRRRKVNQFAINACSNETVAGDPR